MTLSDDDLGRLRGALSALIEDRSTTIPWTALASMAPVGINGARFTIDARAIDVLGAPVVIAHPPQVVLPQLEALSPRERLVATLIAQGRSNKIIAQELSISVATVKDHVHKVLHKLGATSRTQVAAMLHNTSAR